MYRTVSVPGLRKTEAPARRADEFAASTIQLRDTEQFELSPEQSLPAEDSPNRFLHRPGVEDVWGEGAATHTEDSETREERIGLLGRTLAEMPEADQPGVEFILNVDLKIFVFTTCYSEWIAGDYERRRLTDLAGFAKLE